MFVSISRALAAFCCIRGGGGCDLLLVEEDVCVW